MEEKKILKILLNDLKAKKSNQSIALIGNRKMGKSSIIFSFEKLIKKEKDIIFIYLDIESLKNQNIESFLSYYSSKVLKEFAEKKNKKLLYLLGKALEEKITEQLEKIKHINLDAFETIKLSLDLKNGERKADSLAIETILKTPQRLAKKFNLKFVIAIDEFQELGKVHKNIYSLLRANAQQMQNISFLVARSKKSIMNKLLGSKDEPFFNYFYTLQVDSLTPFDAVNFFESRLKKIDIKIDPKIRNEIYEYTKGNPFYLQLLGKEVINLLDVRQGTIVSSEKLKEAYLEMLNRRIEQLDHEFNKLSERQKKLIVTIAVYENKDLKELSKIAELTFDSSRMYATKMLQEDYLIKKESNKYEINDKIFLEYLKKNYKKILEY